MTDKEYELFADDHELMGQLFDKLDHIPDEELEKAWHGVLADMVALIKSELKRQGEEFNGKTIEKIVLAIAHYMGSRSIYLPSGEKIKEALRNNAIYEEFNGKNTKELSKRYGLCEPHIYAIIRKQRQLVRRRYQPDLPY